MKARRAQLAVGFAMLTLAACGDHSDPVQVGAPSFAAGGIGRPSLLVNPQAEGNGDAKNIPQWDELGAAGGKVVGPPGTDAEAIRGDKGVIREVVQRRATPAG